MLALNLLLGNHLKVIDSDFTHGPLFNYFDSDLDYYDGQTKHEYPYYEDELGQLRQFCSWLWVGPPLAQVGLGKHFQNPICQVDAKLKSKIGSQGFTTVQTKEGILIGRTGTNFPAWDGANRIFSTIGQR